MPAILFGLALLTATPAHAGPTVCPASTWRLSDGAILDLGAMDEGTRRWRKFDGTSGKLTPSTGGAWTSTLGWTDRPDGKAVSLANCSEGRIRFDGLNGQRIDLDTVETTFKVKDIELAGRLVLPKGGGKVPIVVLLHGSEDWSALDFNQLQRLLPAEGVGAFVYDKHGTGASGGVYTQNFDVLASEAVAAMKEARRLAGPRAGRVGYYGPSQGGWVAPLAANRASVDFVIVGFGLAISPLEENRQEIRLEMTLKGHGPEEIAKALEVAKAGETIVTSNLTRGFEDFDRVREKYRSEPWYKDLRGNYTWLMLPLDKAGFLAAPERFVMGTPWRYDPMPTLRASKTPQLWVLGEDDLQAPSADTGQRILKLGRQHKPFTLAMFPKAGHGIFEYELAPNRQQISVRNPDGFFAMIRDYARDGVLKGIYGPAKITPPAASR